MPNAPKRFNPLGTPRPRKSACKMGYDRAWQKFRTWFAGVVPAVCGAKLNGTVTEFCCGRALESREMHLDHIVPFASIDDPLRLDPENVAWRCVSCHSKKTASKDGGFGNLT